MLRSVTLRPQAARWIRHEHFLCQRTRHASSKPPPKPADSSTRRFGISWPYTIRKHILRHRSQLEYSSWLTRFLLAGFLVFHLVTTYGYSASLTSGISMMPTMNASGDSVIISKRYRRGKGVQIGDMVSFDHPVDQDVQSIKRVVGLEGDWVSRDTPGVGRGTVIQIPKGHCWVVGDNLSWSRDSRLFGPLPMALIKGKVLARYRLWSDFQWLENELKPAVEDDVD